MRQYQWQDRFSIGVDVIDQAHHRLFLIVQKIMDLYVERHEDKFACIEGIKYFKAYALKHFAEEEAYMRKIGYPGYQAHKKIHDRMRWETLPELERLPSIPLERFLHSALHRRLHRVADRPYPH